MNYSNKNQTVLIIIAINILIYFGIEIFGSTTNTLDLIKYGAHFTPLIVDSYEFFRIISSSFIHIGLLHLLFNMYALFNIGSIIEYYFGRGKFLAIYIFGAIGGSLLTIIFDLIFKTFVVSAGASDAIFALIGFLIAFNIVRKNPYNTKLPINNNTLIFFTVINLFIGFSSGGINNIAHIGGFIAGFLLGMYFDPISTYEKNKTKLKSQTYIEYIAIVILLVASFFYFISIISPSKSTLYLTDRTKIHSEINLILDNYNYLQSKDTNNIENYYNTFNNEKIQLEYIIYFPETKMLIDQMEIVYKDNIDDPNNYQIIEEYETLSKNFNTWKNLIEDEYNIEIK